MLIDISYLILFLFPDKRSIIDSEIQTEHEAMPIKFIYNL